MTGLPSLPTLVVVSGIDGSGKTTQARLLADALSARGLDARYAHATGPNTRLARTLKDRVAPAFLDREDALAREGTTTQGGTSLLGGLFLARGLWQSWATPVANVGADVLVLDRYLYDDLVRVAWRYGYDESWLAVLARLVPDPTLLVRLVAPADVAWARESDGRTTLEEHAAKNARYDRVFAAVESGAGVESGTGFESNTDVVAVDTAEHDVDETRQRLLDAFDERVGTDRTEADRAPVDRRSR